MDVPAAKWSTLIIRVWLTDHVRVAPITLLLRRLTGQWLRVCRCCRVKGGAVSTDLSEGHTFDACHIVEMAGSGGMGVVYQADGHASK
jgi:hypothetical protein